MQNKVLVFVPGRRKNGIRTSLNFCAKAVKPSRFLCIFIHKYLRWEPPFPPGTRRHWSVSGRDNKFSVWPGQQLCAPPRSFRQAVFLTVWGRKTLITISRERERERETTLSVNPHEEQLHESRQKPHLSIKHTCTDTHHTLYLHNLHEPDVSPLWLCSSSPVQQRGLYNRCFTPPQPGLESKDKIWMLIKRETYSRSMLDWITSSYQTHSTCYFMHQVSSKLLLDFRFSAPNTTSSSKRFSRTIQGDDLQTCHLQYAALFTQYCSFEMFSHVFVFLKNASMISEA